MTKNYDMCLLCNCWNIMYMTYNKLNISSRITCSIDCFAFWPCPCCFKYISCVCNILLSLSTASLVSTRESCLRSWQRRLKEQSRCANKASSRLIEGCNASGSGFAELRCCHMKTVQPQWLEHGAHMLIKHDAIRHVRLESHSYLFCWPTKYWLTPIYSKASSESDLVGIRL